MNSLLLLSINARAAITTERIMFLESNISVAKAHVADAQIRRKGARQKKLSWFLCQDASASVLITKSP